MAGLAPPRLRDHPFVPVVATGRALPALLGSPIDGLRVFTMHDGTLGPIPFQVDQRHRDGRWVWDTVPAGADGEIQPPAELAGAEDGWWETSRQPHAAGDDQDPPGHRLFDANDELVFMSRDLGPRLDHPPERLGDARVVELHVRSEVFGADGWAYVAAFDTDPPPRSSTRYIEYDDDANLVRTPIYAFRFSDTRVALIRDLRVIGQPLVDRIKIRGEVLLHLPPPLHRISFDEEAIMGRTRGYIAGPIRVIKQNQAHLQLAGGLVKTPGVTCEHVYYPHFARVPICMSVRFPVRSVRMTVTTDYSDPPFHHVYLGRHPDTSGSDWIALDTDRVSILSVLAVPQELRAHVETRSCICQPHHPAAGERNGAHETMGAGFAIQSLPDCPKGEHVLYGVYLLTPRPYEPGDERRALGLREPDVDLRIVRVWEAR